MRDKGCILPASVESEMNPEEEESFIGLIVYRFYEKACKRE